MIGEYLIPSRSHIPLPVFSYQNVMLLLNDLTSPDEFVCFKYGPVSISVHPNQPGVEAPSSSEYSQQVMRCMSSLMGNYQVWSRIARWSASRNDQWTFWSVHLKQVPPQGHGTRGDSISLWMSTYVPELIGFRCSAFWSDCRWVCQHSVPPLNFKLF